MPIHVPNFVSLKEKYKKTPEMVTDFIKQNPGTAYRKVQLKQKDFDAKRSKEAKSER